MVRQQIERQYNQHALLSLDFLTKYGSAVRIGSFFVTSAHRQGKQIILVYLYVVKLHYLQLRSIFG
jgi:hypothetical protein